MSVLRHARTLPPGLLLRRVAGRAVRVVRTWGAARRDARKGTFLEGERAFVALELPSVQPEAADAQLFRALADRYAAHEFDLLGSGWTRVPPPPGLDVPAGCADEARRIRESIEGPYEPLDWHLDFKSGARWSAHTWYQNVPYGNRPGVDVKVPWELARLQHAPVLALAARVADAPAAARYRREAVAQMLDFVAANPPRFGVNWRTAMDVGIRAANMALTMDLLVQDGVSGAWVGTLARSLEEHARHIAANLEWSPVARGNHYLANVAGIAWSAVHVEASPFTDALLCWAAQELDVECGRQFWDDGGNFEASVCYHRLSAEIVAWTLAALDAAPDARFLAPDPSLAPTSPPLKAGVRTPLASVRGRLPKMASFLEWARRSDGRVAQFGDNDSGRFFRLPGAWTGTLDGDSRRVEETLDVLNAVCGAGPQGLAGRLAGFLSSPGTALGTPRAMTSFGVAPVPPAGLEEAVERLEFGVGCWDGLETAAFPDFGMFVWRSARVWMAVRCGPVGQGGLGGHAHNDALHLELLVDGIEWIADPGTGVYTPDPAMRNAYRSVAAHFAPRVGDREPSSLGRGLFRLEDYGARCHRFGPEGFVGSHDGFGPRVWRVIELTPTGVAVRDGWEGGPLVPVPLVEARKPYRPLPFSPGYGEVRR